MVSNTEQRDEVPEISVPQGTRGVGRMEESEDLGQAGRAAEQRSEVTAPQTMDSGTQQRTRENSTAPIASSSMVPEASEVILGEPDSTIAEKPATTRMPLLINTRKSNRICEWCGRDDCDIVLGRASQDEFKEHRRQSVSALSGLSDWRKFSASAVLDTPIDENDQRRGSQRLERRLSDTDDRGRLTQDQSVSRGWSRSVSASRSAEVAPLVWRRPARKPLEEAVASTAQSVEKQPTNRSVSVSAPITRSASARSGRRRTWQFHNSKGISWTVGNRRIFS